MKKALILFALVAMLALSCAGCIGRRPSSSGSNVSGNNSNSNRTTLTIWDMENREVLFSAITDYELEHDNIEIRVEQIKDASEQLVSSLQMAIGAGTAPDMYFSPSDYILTAGRKGFIYDLTQFGAANVKDKFTDATWKAANASPTGEIFSLPFDANIINFVYNQDMFDDVGIKVPTNMAELQEACQKIKAKYGTNSDKYAFSVPFDRGEAWYPAWSTFSFYWTLWRFGGDIFNAELTECTINSPTAVEALEYYASLKTDGLAPGAYDPAGFQAGNVGMMENTTIGFYQMATASSAKLSVAMMPVLKEGVAPYTGMGLYCYAVVDHGTKTDAALQKAQEAYNFLEFYCTNVDYQVDYCKPYYFLPSLKEASDLSYYQTEEWKIIIQQAQYGKTTPGVENWQEMDLAIYDALQEVFSGQRTAKEALDGAKAKIDAYMQQATT